MRLTPILFIICCIAFSCKTDPSSNFKSTDLMKYGLPITIMAPDSAVIESSNLSFSKDVTIQKGNDYYVQIFSSEATTTDIVQIKKEKVAEVKSNPYFSEMVLEEEDGFIYKTAIDSNAINYGFRHIQIQGDQEFIFQTGLVGRFTLEQTKAMYNAVKSSK